MTLIELGLKILSKFGGLSQDQNIINGDPNYIVEDNIKNTYKQVAADGAVLLKNNGVLPLKEGIEVSLFGRVYHDYFYVGYGSGGDVRRPYAINIEQGIKNNGKIKLNEKVLNYYNEQIKSHPANLTNVWAAWPTCQVEFEVPEDIVKEASQTSDIAIMTIGRAAGEDKENSLQKGSFFLQDNEIDLLDKITRHFNKVIILLNVGNPIDMTWVDKYGDKISAIMYVWQGGMESGNAVADLLTGDITPSGKLADTIARSHDDYPSSSNFGNKDFNNYYEDIYVGYRYFETFAKEKVLYPFGFGLSYTSFEISNTSVKKSNIGFTISVKVKNIGGYKGKEVVQVYLSKPQGILGNPLKELIAFKKTKLLEPNEEELITIDVSLEMFSSYDDAIYADVLQQGEHILYLGNSVENNKDIFRYYQDETIIIKEHEQALAPSNDLKILTTKIKNNIIVKSEKLASKMNYSLKDRIIDRMPKDIPQTKDMGYKLKDVKTGKVSMEEFVAQLSLKELEAISRGDYTMNSKLGPSGNAGALGGVLKSLRDKGVPALTTTDGPSGIRLAQTCTLLPMGTLMACTFDEVLIEQVYSIISEEMVKKGTHILLGPGMNIHRDPLCGRNFEYYSEDPYLTGKIAAAAVRGIQSKGVGACPKHFACNNQEYNRNYNDSRVSERALREIYLKGFEICFKEAEPKYIMTSYNKINGVWNHYNYDLCTTVLRYDWNYKGTVMTDWWMRDSYSPEFPSLYRHAYRVRAQVDVFMPGAGRITFKRPDGTLLKTYGKKDGITLGELQRTAMNVLKVCMDYIS